MAAARRRLVVDTNVWVSMLLPGGMKAIAEAIARNKDLVLFSHEAIRELIRVLAYPRILKFIPPERSNAFLSSLDTFGKKGDCPF